MVMRLECHAGEHKTQKDEVLEALPSKQHLNSCTDNHTFLIVLGRAKIHTLLILCSFHRYSPACILPLSSERSRRERRSSRHTETDTCRHVLITVHR